MFKSRRKESFHVIPVAGKEAFNNLPEELRSGKLIVSGDLTGHQGSDSFYIYALNTNNPVPLLFEQKIPKQLQEMDGEMFVQLVSQVATHFQQWRC